MKLLSTYRYQLVILTFIFLGCALFFQVVMDDAYIPFRYGYNLVNHGIWNFYPDSNRLVESYTTFTYAALSILPALLHIHPYIVFKMIGLVLFFAIIYKLYTATKNKYIALIAILVFTANWQTYVHTYSGLETMFWCWLLLQLIFLLNDDLTYKKQHFIWLICLLLPLTRPEGILISAGAFFYLQFIKKIKINFVVLFIYSSIGIFYFVIRYNYFGMLLPLPFYQKSVKSNTGVINLLINTFSAIHYIICIVLFAITLKKNSYFKWLAIFSLMLFFTVYGTSLLTMNFADRFSYQLFFPVLLFGIIASANLSEIEKVKIKYIGIFLVIFTFAKGFYNIHAKDFSSLTDNLFSEYYYSRTHLNLAMQFRKLNQPKIKVFCNEAGIFPYYSNIDYYDPEGLADTYLSKNVLTKKYIEKINPDAFLYLIGVPKDEISSWAKNLNVNHPLYYYKYLLESSDYEKIGYVVCVEQNVYIGIAVNKKSIYFEQICGAGKEAIIVSENNKFNLRRFFNFKYYNSFPPI